MGKNDAVVAEPQTSRTTKSRAAQFRMPDEIAPKFGVQYHDDTQAQGIVATGDIVELAGVFGLKEPGPMSFPLQKHGSSDGKRFELRVENAASHSLAGQPTVGHQWIFRQTYPELTA